MIIYCFRLLFVFARLCDLYKKMRFFIELVLRLLACFTHQDHARIPPQFVTDVH